MSNTLSNAVVQSRSPSPAQIRAARAILDWSLVDLAKAAQLSVSTIKRMEMSQPQPVSLGAYALVKGVLRSAGVQLLTDHGRGEGVWLERAA